MTIYLKMFSPVCTQLCNKQRIISLKNLITLYIGRDIFRLLQMLRYKEDTLTITHNQKTSETPVMTVLNKDVNTPVNQCKLT